MIKAEIQVGHNQYVLEFPDATDLEKVYNYTLEVATGHKVHKTADSWLDLNKREYDHIRVWEENPLASLPFGMVQPPEFTVLENPRLDTKRLEFLGQKINFKVAVCYFEDNYYVLPYQIDGNPATSMVGASALETLVNEYALKTETPNAVAVLPHGAIPTDQEALDFVKDYAEETEKARGQVIRDYDKAARGFSWPKDEQGE